MHYRTRIVFNGPASDEYTFYSTAVEHEATVDQMLSNMATIGLLRHAVSVQVQRNADPEMKGGWQTRSALSVALGAEDAWS